VKSVGNKDEAFEKASKIDTSKEAITTTKETNIMALYMDIHRQVEGLTGEAAAGAHARDLDVQAKYGVKYLRYWYDESTGTVFCQGLIRICESNSYIKSYRKPDLAIHDRCAGGKKGDHHGNVRISTRHI
jgi:Protein of unknown function (DUF4242)